MLSAPEAVAEVVSLNGGQMVGKTRLQKSLYFLESMGVGFGFDFDYYHYGPYSEDVSISAKDAEVLHIVDIEWRVSDRAEYAVYTSKYDASDDCDALKRKEILDRLRKFDAISLELAATADFLSKNGFAEDPWRETAARKPSKATSARLQKAKELLAALEAI